MMIERLLDKIPEIFAVLAFLVIFFEYQRRHILEKIKVISSIKYQLKIIGRWASANNEGYIGSPDDKKILEFSNPFRIIFDTQNNSIKGIMLDQSVVHLSDNMLSAIAEMNQIIESMKSIENFRRQITASDINLSLKINSKKKESEYKETVASKQYQYFINSLDENEKIFADKIYKYNYIIHYEMIGSRYSKGLKTYFHIINDELYKLNKNIIGFSLSKLINYILYFIPTFFIVILLIEIFNWNNICNIYLIFLLPIIIIAIILYILAEKPHFKLSKN